MENLAPAAGWVAGRAAMGHTRRYAERMNLAKATPQPALASTGYCLADPKAEYLVYVPGGGEVDDGSPRCFKAPFDGDAVLFTTRTR